MTSTMDKSTKELRMQLALTDASKQLVPNWGALSKKHQVDCTTLRRRFQGKQTTRRSAKAESHQCLTMLQEEALIQFINDLTDRYMPPTSQTVKNVAQELCGTPVGKNWVGCFVKRYIDRLRAAYLRTIDSQRVSAEFWPLIDLFYKQVECSRPYLQL
jgi:hypothetical protein